MVLAGHKMSPWMAPLVVMLTLAMTLVPFCASAQAMCSMPQSLAASGGCSMNGGSSAGGCGMHTGPGTSGGSCGMTDTGMSCCDHKSKRTPTLSSAPNPVTPTGIAVVSEPADIPAPAVRAHRAETGPKRASSSLLLKSVLRI